MKLASVQENSMAHTTRNIEYTRKLNTYLRNLLRLFSWLGSLCWTNLMMFFTSDSMISSVRTYVKTYSAETTNVSSIQAVIYNECITMQRRRKIIMIIIISSHYQLLIREGCWDVTALSRGLLEPIPVISLGKSRVHPGWVASSSQGRGRHARCQLHIRSNFGVQYLAQGYFHMKLSSAPGEPGFEPATCPTHWATAAPIIIIMTDVIAGLKTLSYH